MFALKKAIEVSHKSMTKACVRRSDGIEADRLSL